MRADAQFLPLEAKDDEESLQDFIAIQTKPQALTPFICELPG